MDRSADPLAQVLFEIEANMDEISKLLKDGGDEVRDAMFDLILGSQP